MPDTPPNSEVELLTFRVGDSEYSVDIMSVREIRGWTPTTSLPHAPEYVRGVINLRGTILPVLDLARRLGLEDDGPDDRNVIIVVDVGGRAVGLRVDAVSDILTIPDTDFHAPPEMSGDDVPAFVSALILTEGRMVRILDLECVVPDNTGAAA